MLMADGLDVTPEQDVRVLTHVGRPATWVLWSCEEGEDGEDGVKTFLAEAASLGRSHKTRETRGGYGARGRESGFCFGNSAEKVRYLSRSWGCFGPW